MSHVTSTSAVQTGRNCYIFFVQPDNQLGFLKGPTSLKKLDKQDAKPYKVYTISYNSNTISVNKDSTQVAAVSYTQGGTVQIRLYYIDAEGQLAELCTSETDAGLGPWTEGSLNDAAYSADPKTMLTATVDYSGNGQLKLYYQKKLDGFMWCTWVTTGATAWNQQEINSRWDY